jgi:hypothetical protein
VEPGTINTRHQSIRGNNQRVTSINTQHQHQLLPPCSIPCGRMGQYLPSLTPVDGLCTRTEASQKREEAGGIPPAYDDNHPSGPSQRSSTPHPQSMHSFRKIEAVASLLAGWKPVDCENYRNLLDRIMPLILNKATMARRHLQITTEIIGQEPANVELLGRLEVGRWSAVKDLEVFEADLDLLSSVSKFLDDIAKVMRA